MVRFFQRQVLTDVNLEKIETDDKFGNFKNLSPKSQDLIYRKFFVAYERDPETGETKFGAAIFRRDRPNDSYVKSRLNKTAAARLQIRPAKIVISSDKLKSPEKAVLEGKEVTINSYASQIESFIFDTILENIKHGQFIVGGPRG